MEASGSNEVRLRWLHLSDFHIGKSNEAQQVAIASQIVQATASLGMQSDPEWVDLVKGGPRRTPDGRLVTVETAGDAVSLLIDGDPVTPPELEVRGVVRVAGDEVLFEAGTQLSNVPLESRPQTGRSEFDIPVNDTLLGLSYRASTAGYGWSRSAVNNTRASVMADGGML